jgi:hypothetical protein
MGGTGASSYTQEYSYKTWYGKRKTSTSTLGTTASYDLSTFGYTYDDLKNAEKMQGLISTVNAEIVKNQEVISNSSGQTYAQAVANVQALDEMLGNLNSTLDIFRSLGQQVFNSYFGGTLKEIYEVSVISSKPSSIMYWEIKKKIQKRKTWKK